MKIIGPGYIHVFDPVDECPHNPTDEESWQESWVVYFWDPTKQVYMFLRLSQEPNRGTGYATVWLNIWTPRCIYKHTDQSIRLLPGNRTPESFTADGGICSYAFRGDHHWTVNMKGVQVRLRMRDYHPGIGYFPENAGAIISETSKNHIEATGWMTGSVTIKGNTYEVAGTAWRDHSWGQRNWSNMRVHRFFPALFGPEFNFFCVTFVGGDGRLAKFGTVIRHDTVQVTNDFDVVSYMGEDGISNYGGRVTLRLDGAAHLLEFQPQTRTIVTLHHDFHCVDSMCKVIMGDKVGVGVAETSNRAQGGNEKPFVVPPNILDNGVHPA